ncbi:Cytochrome P450 704C1 [Linum perenne]
MSIQINLVCGVMSSVFSVLGSSCTVFLSFAGTCKEYVSSCNSIIVGYARFRNLVKGVGFAQQEADGDKKNDDNIHDPRAFAVKYLLFYIKESVTSHQRPPIAGPVLVQLVNFDWLFDYQTSLAKKYKTYRLLTPSHSEIYTVDPANVEYILKTNFSNYGKGSYNLGIMNDLFGDGIFATDGDKWRHQRKLASHEFSTKVLRDFSSNVFRVNAAKLALKITVAAAASQAINLQDMLMKSTLDSMFKVGFGMDLTSLSESDDLAQQFTTAFDEANAITFRRFVDLIWWLKKAFNVGLEGRLKQNMKIIDAFIYQLIERKREQKKDILSRFLLESKKDPENMTDKYLRDISLNFIIAGKDTTANSLTWFFYLLCKHPLVQEKVAREVRESTNEVSLSADEFVELLTQESLDKMQYLHAALTETLRLHPAVPVDGKSAEEDDVLPDGYKVRKGDGVTYMGYAMGRMTGIWGDDAEEFRPERWLDEEGVFRAESPFKFITFHAGPRICLGKEFAYRQMKIFAASLLYLFKFKLVDEKREATYQVMFTLHLAGGLHLLALPRP